MSKHTVPGWVSNAPVQINVGRDLHIHGGGSALPCDVSPPRVGHGDTLMRGLGVLLYNAWRAAVAILSLCLLLADYALALALWATTRFVDGAQIVLRATERARGGAPNRLGLSSIPLRMLGAGSEVNELEGLNQLESDYEHSN
jgi:hypothetical protein